MQTMLRQIETTDTVHSVKIVPPLDLLPRWPEIVPFVERVLLRDGGCYRAADVFDFIHRGSWQLWTAETDRITAVCITSLESYPTRKECLIRYTAGDMDAILEGGRTVKAWAKTQGCDVIKLFGRKGWEKVTGWKLRHVVLEEEL